MGLAYENLIRPFLFRVDEEKAHDLGVTALDYLGRITPACRLLEMINQTGNTKPIELLGLRFPNAIGMAAGMDKNAKLWRAAPALGFGFIEVGTITAQRQPGNERPRLFRYPEQQAVVNRMGFNNDGADSIAQSLKVSKIRDKRRIPVGINIGKSKVVPIDNAIEDYLLSFQKLAPYADYITINVSSPNTPNLRELQSKEHLEGLLSALCEARDTRSRKLGEKPTPLLLKIAPDLSYKEIDSILSLIEEQSLDGIVATNTTIVRPTSCVHIKEKGGLSGAPLRQHSLQIVNYISKRTQGKLPIIGVGGIDSPESAGAMMDAGAHLLQVYSGMIFKGPFLAVELANALSPRQSDWV